MSEYLWFFIALIVNNIIWMVFSIMLYNSKPRQKGEARIQLPIQMPFRKEEKEREPLPNSQYDDVTETNASINDIMKSIREQMNEKK